MSLVETSKQASKTLIKESFSAFISRWKAKVSNDQLTQWRIAIEHDNKHLFVQYFLNFKALITVGIQIEDAINNGTIKAEEVWRPKRTFGGSNSKTPEVSTITKP